MNRQSLKPRVFPETGRRSPRRAGRPGRGPCLMVALLCGALVAPAAGQERGSNRDQLRTLQSDFPFSVPDSLEQWESRRARIKWHTLISLGLYPLPQKSPLNAVIHGKIELDDYSIEKVYFESFPGYYVSGNLYRPRAHPGKTAGILCPHGHYTDGRFRQTPDQEIEGMIARGEERFKSNAKSPLQARCAHLARMGCTVFHYDMIGYADNQQIPYSIAHRFATQRPQLNEPDRYGFFSPQAELRLQSIMGLQTWNSIRALDFLTTLPEVDAQRIGVTGSSGGGTQTFMLCAVDDRPAAAFPAVMVSTGMQGGCTCENCCNLRIETGNVELAALFAPKPLGLSAANDWTREMSTKGYPELQRLYALYEKPRRVALTETLDFPHGYNQVSRRAMYHWFHQHLNLNGDLQERPLEYRTPAELTVWDADHPQPPGGEQAEIAVLQSWNELQLTAMKSEYNIQDPSIWSSLTASLIDGPGRKPADFDAGAFLKGCGWNEADRAGRWSEPADVFLLLIDGGREEAQRSLPGFADQIEWLRQRRPGCRILVVDSRELAERQGNRLVDNGREAAGYTYGYNRSLLAQRALRLERLLRFLRRHPQDHPDGNAHRRRDPGSLTLAAWGPAALTAGVAVANYQSRLADQPDDHAVPGRRFRLVGASQGTRFAQVDSLTHELFLPGALRYGDWEGVISSIDRWPILLLGESESSFQAALSARIPGIQSPSDKLDFTDDIPPGKWGQAVADWLTKQQ